MTVSSETLRSISRQEQLNDVVVWTTAPFLFRNELVPTSRLDEQRPARTDEVKRLGDHPGVIRVTPTGRRWKSLPGPRNAELLLVYPEPVGTTAASRTPTFKREARTPRRP